MPYLGNGQYQINNANTGETATTDAGGLQQAGVPISQVAQTAAPDVTSSSPFANSPPMQVNDEMQNLQNQSFNNPNLGQMPPSSLYPETPLGGGGAEQFRTPPSSPPSPNQPTGGGLGDMLGDAANLLPMMGPEGLLAKMVIGGGLGLLGGIASGGNVQQDIFDTVGGAAGGALLTGLAHLIPTAIKLDAAGNLINKSLNVGEQALQSGTLTPLADKMTEIYGEVNHPAKGIIPAVTGADEALLMQKFNQERATMPAADNLTPTALHDMQTLAKAYEAKGGYDTNSPSPIERMYRNLGGQTKQLIGYYAGKPYQAANKAYAAALKDKALDQGFGQKLMNIGRGTMYAYYDTMGAADVGKKLLSMGQQNQQPLQQGASGPTFPFNQSLVPGQ